MVRITVDDIVDDMFQTLYDFPDEAGKKLINGIFTEKDTDRFIGGYLLGYVKGMAMTNQLGPAELPNMAALPEIEEKFITRLNAKLSVQ